MTEEYAVAAVEQGIYVTDRGVLIGIFYGSEPDNGIKVDTLPADGRMIYSFEKQVWFWPKEVGARVAKDRLNEDFTQAMQRLQNGWPLHEVLTWYKQDKESEAWAKAPEGQKPETPFLTSLFEKCAALGSVDTFEAMIARIRSNDAKYTEAATTIMAIKHVAEDQIDESDEPMSVTWQFP